MKPSILLFALLALLGTASSQSAKPYFYDAALSPVSNEIVFVSGGDIWTVPANGGEARLLVSNPAMDAVRVAELLEVVYQLL